MAVNLRHWHSHSGAPDVPSVLGCDGVLAQAVPDVLRKRSALVFSLEQSPRRLDVLPTKSNQKTKSAQWHTAQVDIPWSI